MPFLVWPLLGALALCLYLRLEVVNLKAQALRDKLAAKEAIEQANATANRSAVRYEEARLAIRTKTVYVTRRVKDAIAANPVWAAASVPTGVRQSISEAAADLATAKPPSAVREADATGPTDERGASGGIRPKPGLMERLFGPSSSASGGSQTP